MKYVRALLYVRGEYKKRRLKLKNEIYNKENTGIVGNCSPVHSLNSRLW